MSTGSKDSRALIIIMVISVVVVILVALLLQLSVEKSVVSKEVYILPKLNAFINSATFILLSAGLFFIKKQNQKLHKICTLSAFGLSILFLISYVIYHSIAPHTPFGGEGIMRYIYYSLLISHIILAIFVVPLVLLALYRAFNQDFTGHKKITRFAMPIWLYVSLSGVIVYLLISPYYAV